MSTARKILRWAPCCLAVSLGCAAADTSDEVDTLFARQRDLDQRLLPLPDKIDNLSGRLTDLSRTLTDAITRLGQLQMDLEELRKHSPALARFESSQEREARLAELLGQLAVADDAAWLSVKEGLIRLGAPAVAPLLQRVAAGDALALRRVPDVLRNLVDSESVTPLAAGLETPTTRALCAEALGQLGNPDGITWLRAHLADTDANVRHAVAVALGRLKDIAGVPVLLGELESAELDTRLIAIRELEQLAGQDFGYSAYGDNAEARTAAIDRARTWHAAKTTGEPSGPAPGPGATPPGDGDGDGDGGADGEKGSDR